MSVYVCVCSLSCLSVCLCVFFKAWLMVRWTCAHYFFYVCTVCWMVWWPVTIPHTDGPLQSWTGSQSPYSMLFSFILLSCDPLRALTVSLRAYSNFSDANTWAETKNKFGRCYWRFAFIHRSPDLWINCATGIHGKKVCQLCQTCKHWKVKTLFMF